jgi:hypothetical protein
MGRFRSVAQAAGFPIWQPDMLVSTAGSGQKRTDELNQLGNVMCPFSKQEEKRASQFEAVFLPDEFPVTSAKATAIPDPYLASLLTKWGGTSFNHGIYRLLCSNDLPTWTAKCDSAFPEFAGRFIPFGFDWLGRMFVLDRQRYVDGAAAVNLLEPGTGEMLETPCSAESFHEVELVDYCDAALAKSFFHAWLNAGGSPPTHAQCVGYRQPLFLGGTDTVPNLELTDLSVYWDIAVQLRRQTLGLPVGIIINNIRIE